jgi:hypothetical protein
MSPGSIALARPQRMLPVLAALALAPALGWAVTRADTHQAPDLLFEVLLAVLVLVCCWRWRWGVGVVLLYVTVEGAVTNALFPQTTPLLFKDILLAATYSGFLIRVWRRQEAWPPARLVVWPLAALAALCLAEALNPSGVDLPVALVGIRVLLFYAPLYVLGVALAKDAGALPRLTRLVLYTSLPIALVGIFEWLRGSEAVATLGPGFARSIWVIGPESGAQLIYRPTSTFAFVGHYGAYLLFIAVLSFAMLHMRLRLRERWAMVAVFLIAIVAVAVEAQRTTWVLLPAAAVGMYLLHRERRGLLRALPALAAAVGLAAAVAGPVLSSRLPLLTSGVDFYRDRFYNTTGGAFASSNLLSLDAVIGHGTGTALGAIRYVTGGVVPSAFESGWFIPFYMFGALGLIVYVWLYSAVLAAGWRGSRRLPVGERWLGVALLCFLFLTAAVDGPITTPPTNIYFWLFAGLLAGCPPVVQRGDRA